MWYRQAGEQVRVSLKLPPNPWKQHAHPHVEPPPSSDTSQYPADQFDAQTAVDHALVNQTHQIDTDTATDGNDIKKGPAIQGVEAELNSPVELPWYMKPMNEQLNKVRHENVNKMADGAPTEWSQQYQDMIDQINDEIGGGDGQHQSMGSIEGGGGISYKGTTPKSEQGHGYPAFQNSKVPASWGIS